MQEVLWTIFSLICKGIGVLMLISGVCLFASIIWNTVTNGGRKWYYYNPSKPWKGGYWSPLLPDYPPYNEYKWNPETCCFEHKKTGQPLYPWEEPIAHNRSQMPKYKWDWDALGVPENKHISLEPKQWRKRPEWLRWGRRSKVGQEKR